MAHSVPLTLHKEQTPWTKLGKLPKEKNLYAPDLILFCWNCAAFHHLCRFAITRQPHSTLHTLLQVSGYVHKPTVMEESTIAIERLSPSRHIQAPAEESIRVINISFDILNSDASTSLVFSMLFLRQKSSHPRRASTILHLI